MKQQKAPRNRSNKPIVRGPFDRVRTAISFDPKEGLTHQSFKDECDINRIVETYARTGIIPTRRMEPVYGDAPESTLFEAACVQAEIRSVHEEGFEYSEDAAETAASGPEGPISEKEGEPLGSPSQSAPEAPRAASEGDQSAQ